MPRVREDVDCKPKVYYTHWIPEQISRYLSDYCHVLINDSSKPPTADEIISRAYDAFGLCISVRIILIKKLLRAAKSLKWYQAWGAVTTILISKLPVKKEYMFAASETPLPSNQWPILPGHSYWVGPQSSIWRPSGKKWQVWRMESQESIRLNIYGKTCRDYWHGNAGTGGARRPWLQNAGAILRPGPVQPGKWKVH